MTAWTKVVLRIVGVVNAVLVLYGSYSLLRSVSAFVARVRPKPEVPYLGMAFAGMITLNAIFLMSFLLAAVLLFRLSKKGITMHAITSATLIAYFLLILSFWVVGGSFGLNVAAATGIGNAGIAPFAYLLVVPYLYPIASTIALLVVRRKVGPALYGSDSIAAM